MLMMYLAMLGSEEDRERFTLLYEAYEKRLYAKPDGMCDEAWKAIYQYVFALAHGAETELFYYGDWIRKPGVAICSCNDGLRPVIFKLEATDAVSQMEDTPVR